MSKSSEICRRIKAKTESLREDSAFTYIKRPLFTLSGNKELIAQGSISVKKYSDSEIILTVSRMTVSACGRNLEMCFYNKHTVKLSGYITSISFSEQQGERK